MPFKQLPWDPRYEYYLERATILQPPHFFVLYRGISFTDGVDGLDYYRAALLEMDDATKVVLRQHRGTNSSWTMICLPDDLEDQVEIDRIVSIVLDDLKIEPCYIVWRHGHEVR